jgi:fatty acid desaturase
MSAAAPIQDIAATGSGAERFDWRSVISRDEFADLTRIRDGRSYAALAFNWAVVFASFALVAIWPNPLTIVLALFLIGARQLGFAVVMHEASHRSFLSNRRLNDWVGNWLAAYPIWADHEPYRPYHLAHHAHTGTPKDPDLGLATPFPITRKSFARKCWRDLSGQTGWKQAVAVFKRDVGLGQRQNQRTRAARAGQKPDVGWHKLFPAVVTNLVLFGILAAFGHPELYLLWAVAWLTTYRLVTRIRAIAEHAMATDLSHPLKNTRTTLLPWWQRLLIGPNNVNYHLEHHLLMTVPAHNLPRLHEMLKSRGALDDALVAHGYGEVLRAACSKPEASAAA